MFGVRAHLAKYFSYFAFAFFGLAPAFAATDGEVDPRTYVLAEDTDISFTLPSDGGGQLSYSFCFGPGTVFRERTPGQYQITNLTSCLSRPAMPSDEAKLRARLGGALASIESRFVVFIKASSRTQYAQPENAPYAPPATLTALPSKGRIFLLRYDLKFPAGENSTYQAFCLGEGSILGKSAATNRFLVRKAVHCRRATATEQAQTDQMEGQLISLPGPIEADLRDVSYEFGFRWGVLVVPYKFQLSGDREMRGGATVGPYLGLKGAFADLGIGLTPFVFSGAGNTSVRQVIGGKEVDNQLFALSYGGGFMFSIDDAFTAGVVVGFDHVNDDAGYAYNDKPWIAMQLGYDFTQD